MTLRLTHARWDVDRRPMRHEHLEKRRNLYACISKFVLAYSSTRFKKLTRVIKVINNNNGTICNTRATVISGHVAVIRLLLFFLLFLCKHIQYNDNNNNKTADLKKKKKAKAYIISYKSVLRLSPSVHCVCVCVYNMRNFTFHIRAMRVQSKTVLKRAVAANTPYIILSRISIVTRKVRFNRNHAVILLLQCDVL